VDGNGFITAQSPPFALIVGEWKHVIVSFDNKTAVIFVDGQEAARSPEVDPPKSGIILRPLSFVLGANWDKKAEENFRGAFDEVALERRAVPPENVDVK
jgi:hypothetical protein